MVLYKEVVVEEVEDSEGTTVVEEVEEIEVNEEEVVEVLDHKEEDMM